MATLTDAQIAKKTLQLEECEDALQRLLTGTMESRFSHTNEQSTRDITFRQNPQQESMLRRRIDELQRELGIAKEGGRLPIVVCN